MKTADMLQRSRTSAYWGASAALSALSALPFLTRRGTQPERAGVSKADLQARTSWVIGCHADWLRKQFASCTDPATPRCRTMLFIAGTSSEEDGYDTGSSLYPFR